MFNHWLIGQSWLFWVLLLLIGFLVLWIIIGRGEYEFIGFSPMAETKEIKPLARWNIPFNQELQEVKGIYGDFSDFKEENFHNSESEESEEDLIATPKNIAQETPKLESPKKKTKYESQGEAACRKFLEKHFGKPFPNIRPSFLKNPETNCLLELDCYNEELAVAVEYNGKHHYEYPNYTNQSYEDFIQQIRRDMAKRELCDLNGVYLITVPYNVPIKNIPTFIQERLPISP